MAYLRLDGVHLPKLDHHLFRRNRKPDRIPGGDMADYLDEKIISFEELEEDEKDFCLLLSNLITSLIFIFISFVLS